MFPPRTSLAQIETRDAHEVLAQCVTAMAQLDGNLHFTWLNPALSELLGAGLLRWHGASLEVIDPGASAIVDAARRALTEQQVVLLRQVGIRNGPDSQFVGDIAFTPLGDERLLLELHPLHEISERASPALSESLRGFAHEVKNPLAGVRGAAQLLGRRVDTDELRELAELIIGESDRLTALADRLLGARGKPRLVRLNVHEMLERVALLIAAQPDAPGVRRDYDPSLPPAVGDSDRLYQLVLNLARNAVEAGAKTLSLRTRVEFGVRLNERLRRVVLRIDVIDDGSGVPAEISTSLYQPLVSGRPNGTGLGLALAREIADEHGGELRHSSRAGATTFTLLLPLDLSP
jgi:two-component system, NtrC family, nitrogen regulation sensor histidine kinase GlnL